MIGLQDAFDLLVERSPVVSPETIPLGEVSGRVSARRMKADEPVPDFHRAMMDGYAVHIPDVQGASPSNPVRLRVTGQVVAGHTSEAGPDRGEAWEITTGTPLPGGADGVVPYEWTRRREVDDRPSEPGSCSPSTPAKDAVLEVRRPLSDSAKGANVAPPGEDVSKNAPILGKGAVADARHVAVLAALGIERIRVYRRPRVAVVSTGDELVDVGKPREPGEIYDSNSYSVAAAVRETGAEVVHVGSAPDRGERIRGELEDALTAGPHVVVTTGGVSVGPRDLVPDVWRSMGVTELFHGVAIKPGKPVFAGELPERGPDDGNIRVVGLSGTPPANAVAFVTLVRPMLLRLSGRRNVMPRRVRVRLQEGFPKEADMTRLLWCRISGTGEPFEGSLAPVLEHSKLDGICRSNGLVIMAPGTGPWSSGEVVPGMRLDRPDTERRFHFR